MALQQMSTKALVHYKRNIHVRPDRHCKSIMFLIHFGHKRNSTIVEQYNPSKYTLCRDLNVQMVNLNVKISTDTHQCYLYETYTLISYVDFLI